MSSSHPLKKQLPPQLRGACDHCVFRAVAVIREEWRVMCRRMYHTADAAGLSHVTDVQTVDVAPTVGSVALSRTAVTAA